ncbi:hypothetical protein [Nocardioides hwasunensis]|uniref:DUF4395 family protein n=1 Tax=Nocardioides hwasunensis TaxID=397258 RepID=A0ABR8MDI6_9ACTN|nr:hypothetical protein [Nocardioides hwasunensis]MBD3913600.1 hypothetical protein [Nocardioides hwasunensis]
MDQTTATSVNARRWGFALSGLWTVLAVWGLVLGNLWLPLFQLLLAALTLATTYSPRAAAALHAPLLPRRRRN